MACSFCCAPLHAARSLARLPQGAEMGSFGPIESLLPRIVWRRESQGKFSPPIALGGYRLGGCQVLENARQMGLNARFWLRDRGRGKGPAAVFFTPRRTYCQ